MIPRPQRSTSPRPHGALITACLCLLLALPGTRLHAQSEHVPAVHPVHDFLDRLHVRGILPDYSRASLPLVRGDVTRLLRRADSLHASARIHLSETEAALLARYVDEFVKEEDGTQDAVVLFGTSDARRIGDGTPTSGAHRSFPGEAFSDREKFLYRWTSGDRSTTMFMELLGSAEARVLPHEGGTPGVVLGQIGGRFRGTIGTHFGYGLQATNGTIFGNREVALADPVLRQNANFSDFGRDYFDITEAYVSARWGWGDASIGRETILLGVSPVSRAVIGTGAPTFDAVRLNAHAGVLRFSFLHGALLGDWSLVDGGYRPFYHNKFIAAHRLEVDAARWLRLGVFETVIYARRDLDLAYLNPVNFYKSAEHAAGDRDNPMLGFDLQVLLGDGHQLHGTWTIDDVDFSRMGTGWWGNKFLWQIGMTSHALVPDMDLTAEYTRIEPYVFSHTLADNEYTHKGYTLALDLAPNSDAWMLRVRRWFGDRLLVSLSGEYRRHGRNAVSDTGLVRNNGGDIATRFVWGRDPEYTPFLNGPLETQAIVGLAFRWEPLRNYVFDVAYRYRRFGGVRTRDDDHFLSLLFDLQF